MKIFFSKKKKIQIKIKSHLRPSPQCRTHSALPAVPRGAIHYVDVYYGEPRAKGGACHMPYR